MGWFGRKQEREPVVRADYRDLPVEEWTEDEIDHLYATMSEDEYWADWEAWSRQTVEHPRVKKIRRSCLELACEAGRASYPQEFASMMRVEKDTITELVLVPGTIQGNEGAILHTWMLPVDRSVRGSLHTHPTPHPYPSEADFYMFERSGEIHIIIGAPFGPDDWRAYAHDGTPIRLEVVL
jgi:proteasome lid subunit RPN8/RPN11